MDANTSNRKDWLATTHHYVEADLAMKDRALAWMIRGRNKGYRARIPGTKPPSLPRPSRKTKCQEKLTACDVQSRDINRLVCPRRRDLRFGRRHRHRPALSVEALKAKRLKEIRLELSYVPTPFKEEKLNFTVPIGG